MLLNFQPWCPLGVGGWDPGVLFQKPFFGMLIPGLRFLFHYLRAVFVCKLFHQVAVGAPKRHNCCGRHGRHNCCGRGSRFHRHDLERVRDPSESGWESLNFEISLRNTHV